MPVLKQPCPNGPTDTTGSVDDVAHANLLHCQYSQGRILALARASIHPTRQDERNKP